MKTKTKARTDLDRLLTDLFEASVRFTITPGIDMEIFNEVKDIRKAIHALFDRLVDEDAR